MSGQVVELRPGAARLVHPATGALLPDGPPGRPISARVKLLPWARMEIEQARKFLMELDDRTRDANAARLAYLLGALEGHAQTLLDLLDATTEVS